MNIHKRTMTSRNTITQRIQEHKRTMNPRNIGIHKYKRTINPRDT